MDIYKQMAARFDATAAPLPSAEVSKDNEKLTQWYLEHSFFRDFVYRNPPGRQGREFSDALVVYDDTLIVVQNKTHSSARTPKDWCESALDDALGQLRGSLRMITEGLVTEFINELTGAKIRIDLSKHTHLYGIVVAAHKGEPFDPYGLLRQRDAPKHPFSIMTLDDLLFTVDRMDTAADFITYFELRHEAVKMGLRPLMNDEALSMGRIAEMLPILLGPSLARVPDDVRERTLRVRREHLLSPIKEREDYKFGLLVDDIVAHAHDVDPNLVKDLESAKRLAHQVGEIYGYLDRERRISIGKKLLEAAIAARSVEARVVAHIQRSIRQVFLYLFTRADRKGRRDYLHAISAMAQLKYGSDKVVSVATEPVGTGGRSYDFICLSEKELPEGTVFPADVSSQLPDLRHMTQLIE